MGELLPQIIGVFALAGLVKGVIGMGLPTVSLALLTVLLDMPTAMALLLVPSLLTNAWQAFVGGHLREVFKKTWPFLAVAAATVWIGAPALQALRLDFLSALLGLSLVIYGAISLAGKRWQVNESHRVSSGLVAGAVNGVITGMTGSFVVPGVMYLQALGFSRDQLVQAMGLLFLVSTISLGGVLDRADLLDSRLLLLSAVAVLPAVAGMTAGRFFRKRISEVMFRRLFFWSLLVLGGYIIASSVMRL